MKKRLSVLIIVFTLLLGTMATGYGFAVTASLSGGGTHTLGSTFNVTLTYSGGTFGGVQATLSYDSNILEYVDYSHSAMVGSFNPSNGLLVLSDAEAGSLSMTFTFRAKATGNARISVSTIEGGEADKTPFTVGASTTVTVTNPPSSSGSSGGSSSSGSSSSGGSSHTPSSGTNGRGDFNSSSVVEPETEQEEEADPSEKPDQIEVTVGDKTYVIVEDLTDKEFPEGFAAEDAGYGEYDWPIQIAKSEASQYTLILLMDPETEEESWFFYDEETGTITSSKTITVAETLEYERLVAEAAEPEDNTLTIVLGVAAGVFALAFAGLGGYNIYTRKKSKDMFE